MTFIDYLVLAVYLVGITAVGSLGFVSQKSLKEYFLGGRSIPWLASMATLIAMGISATTFIGMPALSFERDLTYLQVYLGMPLAAILAAWFVVPFFYRQDIITAYEYVEKRFDLKTRLLASVIIQILMIFALGTVIAAPAKVLSELSGLSYEWSVLIVGASTAFYTIIGGLKAVIWTDVIQLILMLGCPFLALGILTGQTHGGLGHIIAVAGQYRKFRLVDPSFDLHTEVTLWGALTGLMVYHFASLVIHQSNIQRYLSAKSVRESRKAVVAYGIGLLFMWSLFFLIGIALFAFHIIHPERLPAGQDSDRIFVRFILNEMPIGLRGLTLSGIFAAAMSTISAHLNSLSSLTVVDICQRFFPGYVKRGEVKLSRRITLAWSVASLATALVVVRWGGIVKAGLQIGNFFSGPLLAIFLLGMLTRRTNGAGSFMGGIAGLITVVLVSQLTHISWAWHTLIGASAGMIFGYLLSLPFPAPSQNKITGFTLSTQSEGEVKSA